MTGRRQGRLVSMADRAVRQDRAFKVHRADTVGCILLLDGPHNLGSIAEIQYVGWEMCIGRTHRAEGRVSGQG